MKSSHYYKLLVFALSLIVTATQAADFGDIPANLVLGASKSVRRNAGDTGFEAYTPGSGSSQQKVTFVIDGAGIVLTPGTKIPVKIDPGGTLSKWTITCKPSGSVSVDLLRAANGAGLPVTSMTGIGTKPAISSGVEAHNTITDWDFTTLTANDNLAITLSGISTVTQVVITFYWQ